MCTLHSFPHNIHHCLTYARWVGGKPLGSGLTAASDRTLDSPHPPACLADASLLTDKMIKAEVPKCITSEEPAPFVARCCSSEFEGLLEKTPAEANSFLADPEKYISSEWAASAATHAGKESAATSVCMVHCSSSAYLAIGCLPWLCVAYPAAKIHLPLILATALCNRRRQVEQRRGGAGAAREGGGGPGDG